ncbi:MAG: YncE family protein [Bacteroidetes bacterium]|nr:YncE family protein [Bacteroidota bacterium]
MMPKLNYAIPFLCVLLLFSCSKDKEFGEVNTENTDYIYGKGVFIVNEGNYTNGNGSVSFYNFYTHKIYNGIFETVNKRPLGDVPVSMEIINGLIYITVNNSAKLEVVSPDDFKSVKTITGMTSPRFILHISNKKAYISDLRSNYISVLNLETNTISKKIWCGKSTDRMLKYNNRVFVCNWSEYYIQAPNNTIQVIDCDNDILIDSVKVGKEPNSMVIDNQNHLWVLSSGGYNNEEIPELNCINVNTLQIEKKILFASKYLSPSSLSINQNRDSLWYINTHIYAMSILDNQLPALPLIIKKTRNFYSMDVNPQQKELIISDAIDYNQNGYVYRFSMNGNVIDSLRAGIIPGYFCFTK